MKKFLPAIEWSTDDWGTCRFAPAIDCLDDFVREFAVFGLYQTLADFAVGPYEGSKVAEWYWRASRLWPHQESQEAFNRYARARISDYVGYARRRADAFHIVDRLFDRARFATLKFDEVIDAVAFLSKSESLPEKLIVENGDHAIIDLTRRQDSPKLLKIDIAFLPTLKKLSPFERIDDVIVKHVPVGETAARAFNLVKLAWWLQQPQTTHDEMENAIGFRDGDRLNWTHANLYSKWQAKAAAHGGVPAEFPEVVDSQGNTYVPGNHVELTPALAASMSDTFLPKATQTALVQNWVKEKADKRRRESRLKINRARHP